MWVGMGVVHTPSVLATASAKLASIRVVAIGDVAYKRLVVALAGGGGRGG